jgi:integrase
MWITKVARSPVWYARWYHPDGSGRVVSVTTGETARRAAEAKGRELEAAARAEWERDQRGGTVGSQQVIEEYWQSELKHRKWAASAEVHLERIANFLGDRRYCEVTIADVAQFVDQLVKDPEVSNSTINRVLAVWRRMHNVAGKIRLYPVQQIYWSQLLRDEPEGRTRHLSMDEIKALLSALPEHLREIVAFAILTGARRSQIVTLAWDRVDLDAGTATVFKKHRKQNLPHVIVLHSAAVDILRHRRERTSGPLCFDATNFQHGFEKAVREAGLKDVRFHDLRHTAATMWAKKNSLQIVRQQLGHADMRMTLRYTHVQQEDVRAGIESMPAITFERDSK